MKILFISHEASRTGAPMVLLYLLRWIRLHQSKVEVHLVLLKGGDLRDEFAFESYALYEPYLPIRTTFLMRIWNKLLKKTTPKNHLETVLKKLAKSTFDVIYANTVVSLDYAIKIKADQSHTKLMCHVHELELMIKFMAKNFVSNSEQVQRFIAASNLVKDNLIEKYHITPDKISLIYECSSTIRENYYPKPVKRKRIIVGASGTVNWRKGPDFFLLLAHHLKKYFAQYDFSFQWVGNIDFDQNAIITSDINKMGLSPFVSFLGELKDPLSAYINFDLFVLTSREDPFPLVCIEAGQLGIPIICFEQATGISEIIKDGGGFVVPYGDIAEMAKKIMFYYNNRIELEKDGVIASEKFNKFRPVLICPKLFNEIIK